MVIVSRVPYPLEKGDKLRAYHQIKHLSKKHDVILVALNDKKLHPLAKQKLNEICSSVHIFPIPFFSVIINVLLAFFKGKPLQVGYFFNSRIKNEINKIVENFKPDHIYCQLIRTAEYAKDFEIPKTLDYQDALSKGVERRIHNAGFFKKMVFQSETTRLMKYEKEIFNFFDNKTIISEQDKNLIPHEDYKKITVVPNGVDTDFFKPFETEKKYDLIFSGNMQYPPNVDGAEFLVKKVLPLLLRKKPDFKLVLAGASPSPSVLSLASDNVIVTGWVEDIRPYYAESKIFIAPMQLGVGLQNKLLEAMAMQLPCITSELANNALKASPGKEILIGHSPEEYAKHIFTLLDSPKIASELALNGFSFVHNNYNWDSNNLILETIITNISNFKNRVRDFC